jgi:hypothetical protein
MDITLIVLVVLAANLLVLGLGAVAAVYRTVRSRRRQVERRRHPRPQRSAR